MFVVALAVSGPPLLVLVLTLSFVCRASALLRGHVWQGMWLATREQLRKLSQKKSCEYLSFDESSGKGHVETYSGSIQMFRPNCGLQKVGGAFALRYSGSSAVVLFIFPVASLVEEG